MTMRSACLILATLGLVISGGLYLWERRSDKPPHASSSPEKPALPNVSPPQPPADTSTVQPAKSPIRLKDITRSTGIDFRHTSAMSPDRYPPEAMGSGVAMLDLNSDGWMDLYFLSETPLPVDASRTRPCNRVFRSLQDGRFEDVTEPAGLGHNGFSHGVACGDFDNDGFPDLYVSCYGPNLMYHNRGDGTYVNIADAAALADSAWGTSTAFCDTDEDGDLDMYHCRYAKWTIEKHVPCGGPEKSAKTYCHPSTMTPEPHKMFRNDGSGVFSDITIPSGVGRTDGRGLGVVAADVNGDGHIDLYIANDTTANFLFLGRGDGSFEDVSEESGAAYNLEGVAEASMGIDAEDIDGDGWPELFVTNFWMEHNTLYKNQQGRHFLDISIPSGLGGASRSAMGWGTRLVDLDSDGWPDCFVTNGHLDNNLKDVGVDTPYKQRAQLWHNRGNGKFTYLAQAGGDYFSTVHVGRGVAFGDIDNDGLLDIVVNQLDEEPAVLLNDSQPKPGQPKNHWVRLTLVGRASPRDPIGANLDFRIGQRHIYRQLKGGVSYLSAHDSRLLVGIGPADRIDELTITWPGGIVSRHFDLVTDIDYRLVEDSIPTR